MSVYCPICLSKTEPDMYSGICECPHCESVFEYDEGLTNDEVTNVGCPGSCE